LSQLTELHKIFALVDEAFKTVTEAFPDEVHCDKGCQDCCHAVFDISLIEAVNLWDHIQRLNPDLQDEIRRGAEESLPLWLEITSSQVDPAVARIRCPLLSRQGTCLCYDARPVNCRTYGVPTVIDGTGHVCGLSGFEPGISYPTVNLLSLQHALYNISVQLGGEKLSRLRWPIASIVLDPCEIRELSSSFGTTGIENF